MTLNASGPLSIGGSTAGQSINLELGRAAGATSNLNESALRTLAGVASGAISISNFYGKSNRVPISLTISSPTSTYCVYANRGPTYVAGRSDITVTVNSCVVVGGTNTSSYSMLVPSTFNAGDTVTIVNNGTLQGAGGPRGAAPYYTGPGCPGSPGGHVLYVNRPTTVRNNGAMYSGGGGGGGGASGGNNFGIGYCTFVYTGGPGGGGAGVPGGYGPYGPGTSTAGSPGSYGAAYGGPGGPGGGRGSAGTPGGCGRMVDYCFGFVYSFVPGGSGGTEGYYIVGNPYVTWTATGTRLGRVG